MATAELLSPPSKPRKDPAPRLWTADEFQRIMRLGLFSGRTMILAEGQLLERLPNHPDPQPVVFNRKDHYALYQAGFFTRQRVQLIGGEILQESPMNTPHALCIQLVTKALEKIFKDGFSVRVQLPLEFGPISEPHPDIAVVTGSPRDYSEHHPSQAVLVVEVSESTLEEDTHKKASLYAAAGMADYWVIDVTGRALIFREPQPEAGQPFGHAYRRVSAHSRDEVISPLNTPEERINVNDLLP